MRQAPTVSAAAGNALWAAKVEVHSIDGMLHISCGAHKCLRVVGTELRQQRPVHLTRGEVLGAVGGGLTEEARVEHGRVCCGGAMPHAELAEGELALVHHRRHPELGHAQAVEPLPRLHYQGAAQHHPPAVEARAGRAGLHRATPPTCSTVSSGGGDGGRAVAAVAMARQPFLLALTLRVAGAQVCLLRPPSISRSDVSHRWGSAINL